MGKRLIKSTPIQTIQQAIAWASQEIHSRLEAELLLAYVLKCDRSYLYTWPEKNIPPVEVTQFKTLVERRNRGEPIAYILEEKEFWSLPLKVSPEVLIPRPETELLVHEVLKKFPEIDDEEQKQEDDQNKNKKENKTVHILELGTGSGAIALALARERPHWKIVATDISSKALAVAQHNAQALNITQVQWLQGSWYQALTPINFRKIQTHFQEDGQTLQHDSQHHDKVLFDAILSNPPYIAKNDPHLLQGDLRFEPKNALISEGMTGIKDLQHIIQNAPHYLLKGGWLMLEHGATQSQQVRQLMRQSGFIRIKTYKDLAGKHRMTVGVFLKKTARSYGDVGTLAFSERREPIPGGLTAASLRPTSSNANIPASPATLFKILVGEN